MPSGLLVDLLLIAALILVNAFFAAAEIALVSARRPRLRQLAEEGNRAARTVLRLVEEPARFLSTVQVGITIAGFFASAVGALSLVSALTGVLRALPPPLGEWAATLALIIVTSLIAFASIVLGELVPKTLALQAADRLALLLARPIALLARLARPIVALLTGTTNLILRLLGSRQRAQFPSVSQEELLAMVETGKDEGVISSAEADMTEGVFGLRERRARELMVPRVDVVALPHVTTVAEARQFFSEREHSRVPVYERDLDHILGIVHAKDLLRFSDQAAERQVVGRLITPALYVPESQPATVLLRQLQSQRRHLAVVIDEYGGTVGVVTLEDVLEEIVGEIADEHDPAEEAALTAVNADEVLVSGGLAVADLNDALALKLGEPGVDTVGGLVMARLERFARPGDVVDLGEAEAEVLAMDERRIRRVRVRRTVPRVSWEDDRDGEDA